MICKLVAYHMEFVTELNKIGLTDKEACVYLACLQLGPSPVQVIARRSKVARATTYVVLEALAKKGLVTQYSESKRTLFTAEPPRQLLRVLENQAETVREKERLLESVLPKLQVLLKSGGGRPSVRYYDGSEGLRAIRQEVLMYTKPGSTLHNFIPADHLNAEFPSDSNSYYRQRVAKRIRSKTIFTTKSPSFRDRLLSAEFSEMSERIFVPPEQFPSAGAMTIFENRIAMSSFAGKPGGVILESAILAEMMRNLFQLAWTSGKRTLHS